MIDILTHAFAAAFLIFWGCKINTTGDGILLDLTMYLLVKVVPIVIGLMFLFDIYAGFKGWPV